MAGDWIKWVKGLTRRREVLAMATALKLSAKETAATCMELWEWADENTTDGNVTALRLSHVDALVCVTGFGEAMRSAGWLRETETGIAFSNFTKHNGESSKLRALNAKRQSEFRERGKGKSNVTAVTNVTKNALPEKRREDIDNKGAESVNRIIDAIDLLAIGANPKVRSSIEAMLKLAGEQAVIDACLEAVKRGCSDSNTVTSYASKILAGNAAKKHMDAAKAQAAYKPLYINPTVD